MGICGPWSLCLLLACGDPVVTPSEEIVLTIQAGDQQSGPIGQRLAQEYVVVATRGGEPVGGVEIVWTVASGSGRVAPVRSVTAADGIARTTHTLGRGLGAQSVLATLDPAGSAEARFTSEAVAVPAPAPALSLAIPPNYGIHDTFVRDGIAFVCAWNTGVLIYDIGGGGAGGTVANPVQLSAIVTSNGPIQSASVHNAWWFHNPVTNEKRYLFVGQEGPGTAGSSSSGDIHVVDVSDLTNPVEVGFFHLAGAGTHNFWMDEARQVLYAAYYNGGVVALDVSGVLQGDLGPRTLATVRPGGEGNTSVWGVMLSGGLLYASDMISGFWRLDPTTLQPIGGGFNVPERFGADLWVTGSHAYTATWSSRQGVLGNAIKIWTLGAQGPTLADSVLIPDIRTVSDLQVSEGGELLVASAEGQVGGGIYVFRLTDPLRPVLVAMTLVDTGIHTVSLARVAGTLYAFAARNPADPALLVYDLSPFEP